MGTHAATIDDLKIDSPPPRRGRRRRTPLLGIVLAVGVLGGAGWFLWGNLSPTPRTVEVYTVPTENAGGAGGFTAAGYLEVTPPGALVITAMVEGRVASIVVIEGQAVEAGQVLARLDDVLYRQDVDVKETNVALLRAKLVRQEAGFRPEEIAQAKADLERAKARVLQTRAHHQRSERMVASGVVSQSEYDTTLADFRAAEAEVAVRQAEYDLRKSGYRKEDIAISRAELRSAEAELERARWKVGACVIKAPSSGIVLERFAQPGDWLSPTVSPSALRERPTAVVSLTDPKAVHAWIDVNQRDIERVSVGQTALLATDAQPGRQISGRVSRILPKANLQKNTARVNVEIPDVPAGFRPEMSVKVTFVPAEDGSRYSPGVAVPSQAVVRDGPKTTVLVFAQGRVRVHEVEVSGEAGGRATLQSGVAPGDQVVLNPEGLSDGQPVELKK